MYLMLGTLPLETLDVTGFDETQQATYAEHQVIKGKAKLQATGIALETLNLNIRLHHSLGDVTGRYQALIKMKDSLQAQALIWGKNQFRGYFVIENITSQTVMTDEQGEVLCREVSISLKESTQAPSANKSPALAVGVLSPLTEIPALQTFKGQISQAKSLIKKGVAGIRAVKSNVEKVQNIVENARAFAQSPHKLAALGEVLGRVEALTGVEMTTLKSTLGEMSAVVDQGGEMVAQATEVGEALNKAKTAFKTCLKSQFKDTEAFSLGAVALSQAGQFLDKLDHTTAQATASLMLRIRPHFTTINEQGREDETVNSPS